MIPLLLFWCWALSSSVLAKDYFTAAVFEHKPTHNYDTDLDPLDVKMKNLEYFEKAVVLAAQQKTDIIIFNEYGPYVYPRSRDRMEEIAEHVPDPAKETFNPCEEEATDRIVLHTMSCLARHHQMYILVNMVDIHYCEGTCEAERVDGCDSHCPEDGRNMYNTDVVFDRHGTVVARYHKVHPYFEAVSVPDGPEFVTFETDFGKFGTLVCFDLVFEEAVELVREHRIDTLLFPTYWFDDIVPLTAVEFQQSFAVAHGINFMAANAHAPGTGTLGSGIYTKDGAVVYTYEPDGQSKLLIANVRINPDAKIPPLASTTVITEDSIIPLVETGDHFPEQCYAPVVGATHDFGEYRCHKLKVENYTVAKLKDPSGEVEVCNNGFCCHLAYAAKNLKEDFYLAAFNGLNNVRGYFKWWEETCVLTRCDPHGGLDCALQPSKSDSVFRTVVLEGKFKSDVIYPGVSKTQMRLAPKREWNFEQKDGRARLEFIDQTDTPLLRVTLLGRDFDRDEPFVPFWKGRTV